MLTKLNHHRKLRKYRRFRPARLVVRVRDDLADLESVWPLTSSGMHPSAGFAWNDAAVAAFANTSEAQVFTALAGDRVAAAGALVGTRIYGVSRLTLPGRELSMPTDLAATNARSIESLAAAMVRAGQPLVLDRIPENSAAVGAFRRACLGRAVMAERPSGSYLYVPLDESWVEPEAHLLAVDRRRLALKRRRAERIGSVRIQIHTPDLDELPRLLDAVATVVAPRGASSGARLSEDVFFRQYAEAACVEGSLRISILRIGDRIAAAQLGVESGTGLYLLQSGEEPQMARLRPSQLLARETLRFAAQSNLQTCEFWCPEQPWMQTWTAQRRRCLSLRVYPFGARGLTAAAADGSLAVWHALQELPRGRASYTATCQRLVARIHTNELWSFLTR